jgi:hypothetical protein
VCVCVCYIAYGNYDIRVLMCVCVCVLYSVRQLRYTCPRTHLCSSAALYVSSYCYILTCVVMLLHMRPHAIICMSAYYPAAISLPAYNYITSYYMCPYAAKRVSSYCYMRVLIPTRQHSVHTSAYVSIRRHTSAYVSILYACAHTNSPAISAYVGIRQHTSAYVSILYACAHTNSPAISAYVSIRQHASAYVSIRHACAHTKHSHNTKMK